MPLGSLGSCSVDILGAEADIRQYTKEYCSIINGRPVPKGLPPYIQPPKNSVRWQPGKMGQLVWIEMLGGTMKPVLRFA
jgi:hypothetical protein